MKKRIYCFMAVLCALLLLLSSCTSTYTAVLYGGGGGNTGIPGLPGIGGSQGGGGAGGSQDKKPLPSDHLFYEKAVKTPYSGFSADGSYLLADFSAGLSQAMGQGKYLFLLGDSEKELKAEVAGKNPCLTVAGARGYALYALQEHPDLKQVAVSYSNAGGVRVLRRGVFTECTDELLKALYATEPADKRSDEWAQWALLEGMKKYGPLEKACLPLCQPKGYDAAPFFVSYVSSPYFTATKAPGCRFFALCLSYDAPSMGFSFQGVDQYRVFLKKKGSEAPFELLEITDWELSGYNVFLKLDGYDHLFSLGASGKTQTYSALFAAVDRLGNVLGLYYDDLDFTNGAEFLRQSAYNGCALMPQEQPEPLSPLWFAWLLKSGETPLVTAKSQSRFEFYDAYTDKTTTACFGISEYDPRNETMGANADFGLAFLINEDHAARLLSDENRATVAYRQVEGGAFAVEETKIGLLENNGDQCVLFVPLNDRKDEFRKGGISKRTVEVLIHLQNGEGETILCVKILAEWEGAAQVLFQKARSWGFIG